MTDKQAQQDELPQLIKESQLAARWGKSRRTIQRWRASGQMPRHVRIGSTIHYYVADVISHEDEHSSEADVSWGKK